MYLQPPNVATVSIAAVVGTAVAIIVAAPGVGFALRLVGCQLGLNRAAGGNVDLEIRDGATRIVMNYGVSQGAGGDLTIAPPIPEPGLQLTPNTAMNFAVISSAATGTGFVVVYYYTDGVT
jgi:hypothetical protein